MRVPAYSLYNLQTIHVWKTVRLTVVCRRLTAPLTHVFVLYVPLPNNFLLRFARFQASTATGAATAKRHG